MSNKVVVCAEHSVIGRVFWKYTYEGGDAIFQTAQSPRVFGHRDPHGGGGNGARIGRIHQSIGRDGIIEILDDNAGLHGGGEILRVDFQNLIHFLQ